MCILKKTFPGIQVIHITGKNDEGNVGKKYDECKIKNLVKTFSDNVGGLYKMADVAVTRAGALTVSELSATGLPAILIPFPYATDDHQKENAKMMETAGCAKVICEEILTSEMICEILKKIISNESMRIEMSNAALSIAKPDADKLLCDFVEKNE
jgi:UDP-N-acetylglucosamine--N-acetylmuramyl-(pentapeptide) pyrophosphoryl-undecaprenol N-acetylglucosamine transferase